MTDFDAAAADYDASFTHSTIGAAQRRRVHKLLSEVVHAARPQNILEINCGTGEDAIWLAKQDLNVVATDISEPMIAAAKRKSNGDNPVFLQADINELASSFKGRQFDLIFSNFGGLNCLSPIRLELFFKNAAGLLASNGQLVLVIMPKDTKWEQAYFLAKADFANVFRRNKDNTIANVNGQNVLTYYYNPKETKLMANDYFYSEKVRPIGFFVPPSYLEPFFSRHSNLFSVLDRFEWAIKDWSFLSRHADHFFIYLRKR